jgi:protoporphyrinogen oxidase
MCQQPHGLWHLKKSMQSLSEALESSLRKTGVKIIFGQKVNSLNYDDVNMCWKISANSKKKFFYLPCKRFDLYRASSIFAQASERSFKKKKKL